MQNINFLPWRQWEKTRRKKRFLWFVIGSFLLISAGLLNVQIYLFVCMHREKAQNETIFLKTQSIKKKLKILNATDQLTAQMLHQIYKAKIKSDRIKRQQEVALSSSMEAPLNRRLGYKK